MALGTGATAAPRRPATLTAFVSPVAPGNAPAAASSWIHGEPRPGAAASLSSRTRRSQKAPRAFLGGALRALASAGACCALAGGVSKRRLRRALRRASQRASVVALRAEGRQPGLGQEDAARQAWRMAMTQALAASMALGTPSVAHADFYNDLVDTWNEATASQTASPTEPTAPSEFEEDFNEAGEQVNMQAESAAMTEPIPEELAPFSKLLTLIEEESITRVDFYNEGKVAAVQTGQDGRLERLVFETPGYDASEGLVKKLQEKKVNIAVHRPKPYKRKATLMDQITVVVFLATYPILLLRACNWLKDTLLSRLGFKLDREVMVDVVTGIDFSKVAGIEEAKEEVEELVGFLKDPAAFKAVGARVPKGVLLSGPPGTGKTLLAKALAGEAGVAMIQASASEFVERFVGVGASRVRDIFRKARESAPCIVFIDEIDAIGKQRSGGTGGTGSSEREQTLNQILTEMDGFDSGDSNIIVVAATNTADQLDSALRRPGRFDRHITLTLPSLEGRKRILEVHAEKRKLCDTVDLHGIAHAASGFSGAELENVVNEAAILACRREGDRILAEDLHAAIDRVADGIIERRTVQGNGRRHLAYYHAGQALVRSLLPQGRPLRKVALVPQSTPGLTYASALLAEDDGLISLSELKASVAGLLGGRAAEQLVFGTGQVSSAAMPDLQQAERTARAMVTKFGMSEVGSIAIDDGGFFGPNYSQDLASRIDEAIGGITDEGFQTASTLLEEHRECLDRIAEELMEREALSGERVRELVAQFSTKPES